MAHSGDTAASPGSRSSATASIVFVVASALAGVVLAFPAAWTWARVSDPPVAPYTWQGVLLGEAQLNQQSEITLWFLVVGLGFGLVAGAVAGLVGRRRGVVTVAAVVALCAVAAGLTAYLGIVVFGPDPKAQAATAALGDPITSGLSVGSPVAYLGWPVGGLIGACLAILTWPVTANGSATAQSSSTLIAQSPSTRGP